jgi:hypothetical protein
MADTLVHRVTTGLDLATGRPAVPVALDLVMPDHALLDPHSDTESNTGSDAGADGEAYLAGYGPIPAGLARELVADSLDAGLKTWLRRLYAHPLTGRLVAMDADRRLFPRRLGELIGLRDRYCRTPWCNAPIRHRDHIRPAHQGGATSQANGQGLCAQCNHAKQAPGWTTRPLDRPGGTHTVEITTPTGHTYRSQAPPAPGTGLELRLDLRFAA